MIGSARSPKRQRRPRQPQGERRGWHLRLLPPCNHEPGLPSRRTSRSSTRWARGSSSVSRRAAVEAAHQAWRPSNPWDVLYALLTARHGQVPGHVCVARKVLIAAWHVLSRDEPFQATFYGPGSAVFPGDARAGIS